MLRLPERRALGNENTVPQPTNPTARREDSSASPRLQPGATQDDAIGILEFETESRNTPVRAASDGRVKASVVFSLQKACASCNDLGVHEWRKKVWLPAGCPQKHTQEHAPNTLPP
jgi:hypothetical protein